MKIKISIKIWIPVVTYVKKREKKCKDPVMVEMAPSIKEEWCGKS